MPVYDYKCTCGHTFECRQTFESQPFAQCPRCGTMAHRQLHCPPIIFKGSGFYITDHRKDSGEEKPKHAGTGDTEKKTESKAESKKETKAEAIAETKSETRSETSSGKDKGEKVGKK